MPRAPCFVGDPTTATAYRLGGARVGDNVDAAAQAPLLVITAEHAARLPPGVLLQLQASVSLPVLVVPDEQGRVTPPGLADAVRQALGVLT